MALLKERKDPSQTKQAGKQAMHFEQDHVVLVVVRVSVGNYVKYVSEASVSLFLLS